MKDGARSLAGDSEKVRILILEDRSIDRETDGNFGQTRSRWCRHRGARSTIVRRVKFTRRTKKPYPARRIRIFWN